MKTPLVSIIIVNWNGGDVFRRCLESLARIDYPRWELIVVDNGSVVGSKNFASGLLPPKIRFKLIENAKNIGFAPANNQGYQKARGDLILLLNNDTTVEKNFLSKLVYKIVQDASIGVLQPKIFLMDKPGYLDNAGSFLTRTGFFDHWGFLEKDGPEFSKEQEIFSAKGACMLIRKTIIDKVGLFDRDFVSYFEESDFCWRIWLSGYKVIFYPKSVIHHKVGYTIRRQNVREVNYHYYKNRISSLIKNLSFANLVSILSFHLLISIGIAVLSLLRGQPRNSAMVFRAILWSLWNLPKILHKRSLIQKIRVRTDKELFQLIRHPINWKKFFGSFNRIEEDIKR